MVEGAWSTLHFLDTPGRGKQKPAELQARKKAILCSLNAKTKAKTGTKNRNSLSLISMDIWNICQVKDFNIQLIYILPFTKHFISLS